jgi:heme-degrading monooxygenase HmoA
MINWKDGKRPAVPYYANIFNYYLGDDLSGYQDMDEMTLNLVHEIDGFLGYESHKSENRGSFISYWRDKESIDQWRKDLTHQKAKMEGMKRWYKYYHTMLVKVETARFHEG